MSREIKFRGLHKGLWVYGSYVTDGNEYHAIHSTIVGDDEQMLNQSVDRKTVGQFTGLKDICGTEVYEGDVVEYWDLFECHSDAVDYFGVEPQNNFPVSEVYPHQLTGEVKQDCGEWVANNKNLHNLKLNLGSAITECYYMNGLGETRRCFIADCHERGLASPIRQDREIKLIGNIHETGDQHD